MVVAGSPDCAHVNIIWLNARWHSINPSRRSAEVVHAPYAQVAAENALTNP
jgi:hypothetical protein